MKNDLKFSDLGKAYSLNLYNLNEARSVFEDECRQLNSNVEEYIEELAKRHNSNKEEFLAKIFNWGTTENASKVKEGPWVNFSQANVVPLNLKVQGKRFTKGIAFIKFESAFDNQQRKFLFRVWFENCYDKNENIDETIFKLAQKSPEKFPMSKYIKSNTCVIGCWELDEELVSNIGSIVKRCLNLVEEAIGELYPENSYNKRELISNDTDAKTTEEDAA